MKRSDLGETEAVSSKWDGLGLVLSGRCAYRAAWALQRGIWERRAGLQLPDTLILLEHEPVITIGRHGDTKTLRLHGAQGERRLVRAAHHGSLQGSAAADAARDAGPLPEIVRTDRGGQGTYHGPGQITVYMIADLRAHGLGVRQFVSLLEEGVIRALWDFGISAFRREGLVGVWTLLGMRPAKIAAIGVRIARGVSIHGVALNVTSACLDGFRWMVPCGLEGEAVTAMEQVLGRAVDTAAAGDALLQHLGQTFGIGLRPVRANGISSEKEIELLLKHLGREAERGARKPHWLRVELPSGSAFAGVRKVLKEGALFTVCEEARCPNRQECWSSGTATFMILGRVCTRRCKFCAVRKGRAGPADPEEPERIARAAEALELKHVVVTSVTRDDLPDGGAAQFAATIQAIRRRLPGVSVEVLIPDFAGSLEALGRVFAERPEVLNHNVETTARLYGVVRPGADYRRSLEILRAAAAAGLSAKSGFMVGLGESEREIAGLLRDLREAGCERVTIGQYLQPRRGCLPVKRYWTPGQFASWRRRGLAMGFAHVESGPLVRSSYHAAQTVTP